jgi:hypothetical protein
MFTDAGLRETSNMLDKMGKDFDSMTSKNEFLMNLSPRPTPQDRRSGYAENLELFAVAVDEFLLSIKNGIKTTTQIKLYNLKLMKNRLSTIMSYEGTSLKYFRTKKELNEYRKWSKVIDRVNSKIEQEVEASLTEMERGFRALS